MEVPFTGGLTPRRSGDVASPVADITFLTADNSSFRVSEMPKVRGERFSRPGPFSIDSSARPERGIPHLLLLASGKPLDARGGRRGCRSGSGDCRFGLLRLEGCLPVPQRCTEKGSGLGPRLRHWWLDSGKIERPKAGLSLRDEWVQSPRQIKRLCQGIREMTRLRGVAPCPPVATNGLRPSMNSPTNIPRRTRNVRFWVRVVDRAPGTGYH